MITYNIVFVIAEFLYNDDVKTFADHFVSSPRKREKREEMRGKRKTAKNEGKQKQKKH